MSGANQEALAASTVRLRACRLRLWYMRPHGSWLNVAEVELSRLVRQYLNRSFGSAVQMDRAPDTGHVPPAPSTTASIGR